MKLAEIFQNGMVLQRRKPICIWGEMEVPQSVRVFMNDVEIMEEQMQGEFKIFLPPQEAVEGAVLLLKGNKGEQVRLEDIDIGEVWLAGGQSNMDFELQFDREGDVMASSASDPHFRFYDVGEYAFKGEREEGLKPDEANWFRWMDYTPEHAGCFSAVAVYFAMQLRKSLKVPVGVIGCSWGGTKASAWIDEKMLQNAPVLSFYTDTYEKNLKTIDLKKYEQQNRRIREQTYTPKQIESNRSGMKTESQKPPGILTKMLGKWFAKCMVTGPHSENRPGALYETMIRPVAGFTISGIIWYQGESDVDHAEIYDQLFSKMIHCFRTAWQEELPFLFVQLAPFEAWMASDGKRFPAIRRQQQKVENTIPKTYMASIMDCGSRYDIHPKQKRPVGERLAALALNEVYGHPVSGHAPNIDKAVVQGASIILSFKNTDGGLVEKMADVPFSGIQFLLSVKQCGKTLSYTYEIVENQIRVEIKELKRDGTVTVSFAEMPYCKVNIYGKNNLPVRPFSIELAV